ncbi:MULTISPECIES: NAD-dependent epimerase/dehydratase family protein [unclassified Ruegeria]|uniref:NAD-dependent epimerase/dehydratase family protein n=1 Tax=unclassified Ruegeria TaxID=2625375 RepID=UPI001AD9A383|nr:MULTISPECIES: NAD-dependent epimerase/dehydratase family protein [unclassified Ruegeria]MBO9413445.1 NAD(P)H-binding protein [Ruegeria sp. R8_1]MBO9417372.1 NAD(P)H-binding protein [Ruegeria sp. R8_2]
MSGTALVFGGTGLVGRALVDLLIRDERWERVVCVDRKPIRYEGHKVVQVLADKGSIEAVATNLCADTVFCCLGTTQKVAGSREAFREIDHDYVLQCARIAYRKGATRFLLVSSMGARIGSISYYAHVKGETERDLARIGYPAVDILRPSLLLGDRLDHRFKEKWAGRIMPHFNFLLCGPLKKYRPIKASQVARAMGTIAHTAANGVTVYTSDKLESI